ncbi:MAG: hypothetical protein R6U66_04050 [Bacteroidales bacterium]
MDTIEQEGTLTLPHSSVKHLLEIRKWTMFLSIVGFIFIGLGAIVLPFWGVLVGNVGEFGYFALTPVVLMLVIYFFPIYYLYKFSSYAKQAERSLDPIAYDNAFLYLKKHYRFIGILLLVVLVLYVIIGLVAALGLALT